MIILSPPRINPAGSLTQFSLPDSLNAKKGQKQNHQSVACLFACQFTIYQSSLFSYPFAAPPPFSAPFSSAALFSSSCHRCCCCRCCPHCTRSPRCNRSPRCCCVLCLCLHQLMVLLGYDLVLRTSCPSCSSVSCWDALTCSAASSTARGEGEGRGEVRGASCSSLAATKNVI